MEKTEQLVREKKNLKDISLNNDNGNDNESNESFINKTLMSNDSLIRDGNVKPVENYAKKSVENLADYLVKKFNAPHCRMFFLKCGWHLSENFIWTTYEAAQRDFVRDKLRYFIHACNVEMCK